jgi:hypothetical protein
VLYELPRAHAARAYHRLRGWSAYPFSLLAVEIAGNLAGPFALWRSRRRVKRLGRSAPSPLDDFRAASAEISRTHVAEELSAPAAAIAPRSRQSSL